MTTFIVLATLLVIAVAIPLAVALLRHSPDADGGASRQAANLAILRDQLVELERERREGSLAAADFDQAKKELQRRILEEASSDPQTDRKCAPARKTALALLITLPLLAMGVYAMLGTPAALDPVAREPVKQGEEVKPEIPPEALAMVARLAERLKENPNDPKGWVMLGRSYKAMGRYDDAVKAYGKGLSIVKKDAGLLSDYAELLAMTGKGFDGKPTELINMALKLDPNEPKALLIAGAAARHRGDYKAAADYWEKVLPQLEPGSEFAEAMKGSAAEARAMANVGSR